MEYSQLAWIWLSCCCCYWQIITVISSSISMTTEQTPSAAEAYEMRLKTPEQRRLSGLWGKIFLHEGPTITILLKRLHIYQEKKWISSDRGQSIYERLPRRSPQEQQQTCHQGQEWPTTTAAASAKHPGNKQRTSFQLHQQLTIFLTGDDIPNAVCSDNNRFVPGTKNNWLRKTQQEKKKEKKTGRKREEDGTDGQMNRG